MSTLAERLKLAMKNRLPKATGAALAKAVGISAPSVSDWMTGNTKKIEGENLMRASAFLGVNPFWLATGKGNMFDGINASITSNNLQSNSLNKLVSDLQELNAQKMLSEEAIQILQSTVTLLSKSQTEKTNKEPKE